ncbi:amphi-Trp domain-containing protein [Halostagnicola bangensis]
MGDTTSYEDEIAREEASDLVQELARELRNDDVAEIRIGNKMVTLSPASSIEYSIEAQERSPMLGGAREEITLELAWKVEEDT